MLVNPKESNLKALIYDCEIIKAIPGKYEPRDPSIKYCDGWHDHANMGISVICAYHYPTDRYRVFCQDNFGEFQGLVMACDQIIGFNSIKFDDQLCAAHGIKVQTTYDLLCEVFEASGQPRQYTPGLTRSGYGLHQIAHANLGQGKTGNGALAPVQWQYGQIGQVIDYCLQDVALVKKLIDKLPVLIDPTDGSTLNLPPVEASLVGG